MIKTYKYMFNFFNRFNEKMDDQVYIMVGDTKLHIMDFLKIIDDNKVFINNQIDHYKSIKKLVDEWTKERIN